MQSKNIYKKLIDFLVKILIFIIRVYQVLISPLFPKTCRFYPSCSQYAIEAINKYGPLSGSFMTIKRVLRCNPWNPGGYDPIR